MTITKSGQPILAVLITIAQYKLSHFQWTFPFDPPYALHHKETSRTMLHTPGATLMQHSQPDFLDKAVAATTKSTLKQGQIIQSSHACRQPSPHSTPTSNVGAQLVSKAMLPQGLWADSELCAGCIKREHTKHKEGFKDRNPELKLLLKMGQNPKLAVVNTLD